MPFPTPLGHRLGYDRDGTVVLYRDRSKLGGGWHEMPQLAKEAMNSTVGGGVRISATSASPDHVNTDPGIPWEYNYRSNVGDQMLYRNQMGFLFPELTELTGIYLTWVAAEAQSSFGFSAFEVVDVDIYVSEDTTNLSDGAWSKLPGSYNSVPVNYSNNGGNYPPAYFSAQPVVDVVTGSAVSGYAAIIPTEFYRKRLSIGGEGQQVASARRIRGIRLEDRYKNWVSGPLFLLVAHLYGTPETSSQGEFLSAWSPTLDKQLDPGHLSWGDHPRSSSADKTFRVRNSSSVKTAMDVLVSVEDAYGYGSPFPSQQLLLSLDGDTWAETVTIGALSPGSVSPIINVRRNTPVNAPLGSWSPRIVFDVGSWI